MIKDPDVNFLQLLIILMRIILLISTYLFNKVTSKQCVISGIACLTGKLINSDYSQASWAVAVADPRGGAIRPPARQKIVL